MYIYIYIHGMHQVYTCDMWYILALFIQSKMVKGTYQLCTCFFLLVISLSMLSCSTTARGVMGYK